MKNWVSVISNFYDDHEKRSDCDEVFSRNDVWSQLVGVAELTE